MFAASGGQLRKVSMKPSLRLDRWARPHRGRIHNAAFHPDGKSLLTVGEDRMFRIWDAAGGKEMGAFESGAEEPGEMMISPGGESLVVGGEGGEVAIYDLGERRPIWKLPGNRIGVVGLGFTPDGKILVGQHNGPVRVCDKGSVESTIGESGNYVFRIRFSPDGRFAARSDSNKGIDYWEIASGKRHWAIQARDTGAVGFSSDGNRIYYSRGRELVAVDVRSQAAIRTIGLEDEPVYCGIVPDPTGRFLALVHRSNTLVLLHAGTLREVLRRPIPDLSDVHFSPDGKKLAMECGTSVSMMELRAE